MKRRAVALITAPVAVLIVGGALAGSGAAQPPAPPTGTLDLVLRDREVSFRFVDNPPRSRGAERPSIGDQAIIGGPLRNTSNRRVGRLHVIFTRVRQGAVVDLVRGTFVLRGGHIVVEGIADEAGGRRDELAITGGTGSYAGARGTLSVIERRTSTSFTLTFIG